jgi:hypothetical protein
MGRFCNGFLPGEALKFCGRISKDKRKIQSMGPNAKIMTGKNALEVFEQRRGYFAGRGNQFTKEYSKLAFESVC